jgi:hypothetical protein
MLNIAYMPLEDIILMVQVISWLAVLAAIITSILLIRRKRLAPLYFVLPGLVYLNLFLFLSERILVKTTELSLFPPGVVNNWAVGIQFHIAISAAIGTVVLLMNGKGLNE